jgi:hypothetical protein
MTSRRVALTASFVLAMTGATACDSGSDNEDGHFYCTDASGTVINEDLCDDPDGGSGGGFFFMYMGSSMHAPPAGRTTYPVGHKMPANLPKLANTSANRTKFGLPASGRISNGTVKTGVVGKGGPGSTAKGGSGGARGSSGGG